MKIEGTLALVTGASQGIGAALALELSRQGAGTTILLARNGELMRDITAEINSFGGKAYYYVTDLSDTRDTYTVLQQIKVEHGVPDIIINNAGIGRFMRIEETSREEARDMIALPYLAAFDVTRFFIEDMLDRQSGHLIFINSPASVQPWASAVTYAASRWAMRGLAKALRADLYGSKIRVMHVIAGKTTSNYWSNNPGSLERMPGIEKIFRKLEPAEVARAVVSAIRKNRRHLVIPFMLQLTMWVNSLFPWLIQALVLATGLKRKK